MRLKIFLIFVSVTLVSTGLWLKWEERKEILSAVEAHNRRWTPDFDLNLIAAVLIKTNSNSLLLERNGNHWIIRDHDKTIEADVPAIGKLVNSIKTLKPTEEMEIDPSRFPDFEILEPDGVSPNTGTLVELRDGESQRIAALIVGKKSYAPPEPKSPFPATSNGRFIRQAGSTGLIGVVSGSFDDISTDPAAWMHRKEAP